MSVSRAEALKLIFEQFSVEPEYPWEDAPEAGVFRHPINRKWFGIIMPVRGNKVGLTDNAFVDVINVKINPLDLDDLLMVPGIVPAYHMNKKHWISVVLSSTINLQLLSKVLQTSYDLIKPKLRTGKKKA